MILAPYFSIMNNRYSNLADDIVNSVLDEHPKVVVDRFYAHFYLKDRMVSIWIENKWYGFATQANQSAKNTDILFVSGGNLYNNQRPSRKTMIRLENYLRDHESEGK